MPTVDLVQAQIVPAQVGQFGIKATDGKWYSVDAPDLTKDSFIVGQTYAVGLRYSKTGKPYVKQVYSGQLLNGTGGTGGTIPSYAPPAPAPQAAPLTAPLAAAPAPAPRASAAPVADEKMSKSDWARKDIIIGRQAVIKSTLESPGVANLTMGLDKDGYLAVVREIAENLEGWVNR